MNETDWLATEELCQRTGASARQLERWRQQGLVTEPRREYLGRKGSISFYPATEVLRVRALTRLVRRGRPLDHVRVLLWAEGYDNDEREVRQTLVEAAKKMEAVVPEGIDPEDAAEALAEGYRRQSEGKSPRSHDAQRLLRILPKESERVAALRTVLAMAFGGTPPVLSTGLEELDGEPKIGEVLERAAEVTPARTAVINGAGPWLTGRVGQDFEQMALEGTVALPGLAEVLSGASDAEWKHARATLQAFNMLAVMAPHLERAFGPFGFSGLREELFEDLEKLAFFLAVMIRFHREGYSKNMDIVTHAIREGAQKVAGALNEAGMSLEQATQAIEAMRQREGDGTKN